MGVAGPQPPSQATHPALPPAYLEVGCRLGRQGGSAMLAGLHCPMAPQDAESARPEGQGGGLAGRDPHGSPEPDRAGAGATGTAGQEVPLPHHVAPDDFWTLCTPPSRELHLPPDARDQSDLTSSQARIQAESLGPEESVPVPAPAHTSVGADSSPVPPKSQERIKTEDRKCSGDSRGPELERRKNSQC